MTTRRIPASDVTRWRHDRLVALHGLIGLVERGCRSDLAARILAPLDPRKAA